ncbi:MAG: bifunctional folylpolyglutamate synthase/dihydrofolate synthase [Peptostreptococcaceae bacterium]|nr:bifunctional folylpolyglutamate synthase/dihydrofolate synthase [Peptostreptococcaceae bacterium]
MNYTQAMDYIESAHKFGINLGLPRTLKILEILGEPQDKIKCIHIAGTNGKGSVTAMTTEILIAAGYKVGMYTSPFLEEFEERIQINGVNIPKDDLADMVTKVAKAVGEIKKLGYEEPTEFEIITCAMYLYFYEQKVDYAVIEVGLGGRQDSTNVMTPVVSAIVSISFDHMNILGDTLAKIAYEKAGIIKKNIPVVLYPQEQEAYDVFKKAAAENNSKIIQVSKGDIIKTKDDAKKNSSHQQFTIKTKNDEYDVKLGLLGIHQYLNTAVAINIIETLNSTGEHITKEQILKGLENVKWIGRLEIMSKEPLVVIDGAHNIDGITNLAKSIEKYFSYKKMVLVLGILADKQVTQMIEIIAPFAKNIITVSPHSDRATGAEDLKIKIDEFVKTKNLDIKTEAEDDYETAFKKARAYCDNDDMLLVAGSLYLIGDMRKIIRKFV